MDRLIVARKLDSLQRCLARVKAKCPSDADTLAGDVDLQDIVVLNLSRAVQLCVDLAMHALTGIDAAPPETMGQAFDRLAEAGRIDASLARDMKRSVGFRNIAVHNYSEMDWHIVHAIATRHMDDFRRFEQAMRKIAATDED